MIFFYSIKLYAYFDKNLNEAVRILKMTILTFSKGGHSWPKSFDVII